MSNNPWIEKKIQGHIMIRAKYDGCLEIIDSDNGKADLVHICDFDNFVAELYLLEMLAKKEYPDTWEGFAFHRS